MEYLCSLGMAWAAVFLTKGDMSLTHSLIESSMIGTMMGTRMLDNTLRALALINWFGSCEQTRRSVVESTHLVLEKLYFQTRLVFRDAGLTQQWNRTKTSKLFGRFLFLVPVTSPKLAAMKLVSLLSHFESPLGRLWRHKGSCVRVRTHTTGGACTPPRLGPAPHHGWGLHPTTGGACTPRRVGPAPTPRVGPAPTPRVGPAPTPRVGPAPHRGWQLLLDWL